MKIEPCTSLAEVLSCWELLYRIYLRAGFVSPNPWEVHVSRCAVGPQTCVIRGSVDGVTAATISVILDGPAKLPLDVVYPHELNQLRSQGIKMAEIGLFGEQHGSLLTLMELTRYAYVFAKHEGMTDIVCGIPPRRTRIYNKAFGFSVAGAEKKYPSVRDNPVVLLRANYHETEIARDRIKGIDEFLSHPTAPEIFSGRYLFPRDEVAKSDHLRPAA